MHSPRPWTCLTLALAIALASGCGGAEDAPSADGPSAADAASAADDTAAADAPEDAFWAALSDLCGQAFEGMVQESEPPDPSFADQTLVMHVRECDDDAIRIPFHVGDDRSRTWVLTRTDTGLRLKHDHRHEDGTPDDVTWYGGDASEEGTATRQSFAADEETAALLPEASTNVWTLEIEPGERFVYALRREGTERRFRAVFDLGVPVPAPPPPWGASGDARVPETTEGFVDAGHGVRLYYRVVGTGPDTMVVLHGGPGFDMEYFAADLEPLADRIALVFYDQRGAGRSSLVRDSLQLDARLFAEDLEAVRRHFGLERMTLFGHSWGAGVAALYAMRYPSRVGRMLVVGGVPLRQQQLGAAFEQMNAARDSAELRQMRELYEARLADPEDAGTCRAYYVLWFRPFFADAAAMDRSRGDFCAGTPESLRNKMESVDRFTGQSLGDWDWREPLRDLPAPTLVIHGTADPIPVEAAREWAATLPDARLLLLDGVGHFPYLEAPDRFFPAVRQFVRDEWPAAAQE